MSVDCWGGCGLGMVSVRWLDSTWLSVWKFDAISGILVTSFQITAGLRSSWDFDSRSFLRLIWLLQFVLASILIVVIDEHCEDIRKAAQLNACVAACWRLAVRSFCTGRVLLDV